MKKNITIIPLIIAIVVVAVVIIFLLIKENKNLKTIVKSRQKNNYVTFNFSKAHFIKADISKIKWSNEDTTLYRDQYIKSCSKSNNILCLSYQSNEDFKTFILKNFDLYKIISSKKDAIATGYYIPTIKAQLYKDEIYKYPIYKIPKDLIVVKLGSVYPELKGKNIVGRLAGNKIVPYYTRGTIDTNGLNADIIAYAKDKIDILNAQIQGSSMLNLVDINKTISITYAQKNGYKYTSIGKYMIKKGYITYQNASMQGISTYIKANPEKIEEIMAQNKSYIFFNTNRTIVGALGIPLTGELSVAVDRKYIPLGSMLYIKTTHPLTKKAYNKVVYAQDTGGAIKGSVRVDLFFGYGALAKRKASAMKYKLTSYIFVPKNIAKKSLK